MNMRIALLLLCSLWLQLLSSSALGVTFAHALDDDAHLELHWQQVDHHHHDGEVHVDDSAASAQHLTLDCSACSLPGYGTAQQQPPLMRPVDPSTAYPFGDYPTPPDTPFRPPQA